MPSTTPVPAPGPAPWRGSLATPAPRVLAWCLHLLVGALLVMAVGRAFVGGGGQAWAVGAVGAAFGAVYAVGPVLPAVRRSRRGAVVWLVGVGVLWAGLLALTADAMWLAFPLFFVQLHLLAGRAGPSAVALTTGVAVCSYAAHQGRFTAAAAIGPVIGAAVAIAVVRGYQALYRESEQRRRLIEELTRARADLAAAQHTAGVMAERERLAREIHDTLAQGLSSIQLLLRAAQRSLGADGGTDGAGRYVEQARQAAADNLAEARRFVAALAPQDLEGTTLAGALERLCATTSATSPVTVRFHLAHDPGPLSTAYEVALLRIAQAALGNTVRHAGARTAAVTLSGLGDAVALDVVDDGRGFEPAALPAPDPDRGGFGIPAMRARTRALGGTLTIESRPGAGTAVAAQLPLPPAPSPYEPARAPEPDPVTEAPR
ncbi:MULTISPECIES: sensor histidine kinase [Streptomyces diastaticus group]|uniref:Sensor histidine kinase n=1 Tax=Streptomyces rutgersensis TaxID=53451 RepID=A0ABX6RQ83_9ACTN|nr:sensor histidine kinase [Streptomyces rutgersensis]QNE82443.1 sensor histidine kinase [Streptomyces rutgersensis]WSU36463.1 sensor histidine kinase [Streptomyces gougerotii]